MTTMNVKFGKEQKSNCETKKHILVNKHTSLTLLDMYKNVKCKKILQIKTENKVFPKYFLHVYETRYDVIVRHRGG